MLKINITRSMHEFRLSSFYYLNIGEINKLLYRYNLKHYSIKLGLYVKTIMVLVYLKKPPKLTTSDNSNYCVILGQIL